MRKTGEEKTVTTSRADIRRKGPCTGEINSDLPLIGLVSIIMRNHAIYFNKEMEELNLTVGQLPYLMRLSHEQGLTQDDLADDYFIDKGTVARALKKLEDNGLVKRIPDSKNRRKNLVFLTDKGERIIPVIDRIDQRWEEMICENLTAGERSMLLSGIRTLAKNTINNLNEGD